MKIIDIITPALADEFNCGNLAGIEPYVPTAEDVAVLKALEEEDKGRYLAIEAAFSAEAGHFQDQYFRVGFAAGLRLAAETFNGLAEMKE